jgi:predicted anti-sigma-YlaC factor YlaD
VEARCSEVEETISAELDGEEGPVGAVALASHLGRCPGCRRFARRVTELHRSTRVRLADSPPDLTAAILSSLPTPAMSRASRWRAGAQLALVTSLPSLFARRCIIAAATAAAALPISLGAYGAGGFAHYVIRPSARSSPCTVRLRHGGGEALFTDGLAPAR